MKNEFPISNLRAKYADKTADGKDISEAIAEAQLAGDIPELTYDTFAEIFATKPKLISYTEDGNIPMIYIFHKDFGSGVEYSSVFGTRSSIISFDREGPLPGSSYDLAKSTDVGTKLYLHKITVSNSDLSSEIGFHLMSFKVVSTDPNSWTGHKGTTILNDMQSSMLFNVYSPAEYFNKTETGNATGHFIAFPYLIYVGTNTIALTGQYCPAQGTIETVTGKFYTEHLTDTVTPL